jgi:hypothetical protein
MRSDRERLLDFDVDHDIVWRAAAEDLPPVATRLREALAEVI